MRHSYLASCLNQASSENLKEIIQSKAGRLVLEFKIWLSAEIETASVLINKQNFVRVFAAGNLVLGERSPLMVSTVYIYF